MVVWLILNMRFILAVRIFPNLGVKKLVNLKKKNCAHV